MLLVMYSIGMLIILPAVFIAILWFTDFKSKLEWILDAITTILLLSWLFQVGNWDWVGYSFRYLWVLPLMLALFFSWKKVRMLPFNIKYTLNKIVSLGIYVFLILIFGTYNALVFTSYSTNEKSIDLFFPMNQGTYYIGQGRNHVQMNYHQEHPGQKYALDIVKLNAMGTRANGIYPKELEKYNIYRDDLLSPCNGNVLEMENNLPDQIPPETDSEHPEGNYVVIVCEQHEAAILLAHMQQGSILVANGDQVKTGQHIGKVGNSGNTSEPHLHIHAEVDGKGVPITFNDQFLVRNNLVKLQQ